MTIKITHNHVRRISSRGWRANGLLILSFLTVLAFLNATRNTENHGREIIKVLHIWEHSTELPSMKEVLFHSDDET